MSNKITVLIIHRFPASSNSFPFISLCSNGWHQAFVKVKVARPTSDDTTDQFFHFLRSASLLLLSVQFQHLEAMPKCKASSSVRKISLINVRPLNFSPAWFPAFLTGFVPLLVLCQCVWADSGLSLKPGSVFVLHLWNIYQYVNREAVLFNLNHWIIRARHLNAIAGTL